MTFPIALLSLAALVVMGLAMHNPQRGLGRGYRLASEPPLVAPPVGREPAPLPAPDRDYIKHVVRQMPMSVPLPAEDETR